MGLFGQAWNEPERIAALLAAAGELDMLASFALVRRTCFAEEGGAVILTDLYHPGLETGKRIYNSVTMDPASKDRKAHVLLTGPNRGGKSTLLKALGLAVLMAQTVGFVFARSATLPTFGHIITALSPQDVVGKMSLFEAEIEFAKEVKALVATAKEPVFLMMDEIFHGTNAHDGVDASKVFLDDLYAPDTSRARVFSVVSTHYMDLPARYGLVSPLVSLVSPLVSPLVSQEKQETQENQIDASANVSEVAILTQNLCMDASIDPADPERLIYTYKVIDGVNNHSSVREILRERGLFI
jgi:DNA mismatch repair ATPase MutS